MEEGNSSEFPEVNREIKVDSEVRSNELLHECPGKALSVYWSDLLQKPIFGKEKKKKLDEVEDMGDQQGTNPTTTAVNKFCCDSNVIIREENMMPQLTNIPTSPTHSLLSTRRQKSKIPKTGGIDVRS